MVLIRKCCVRKRYICDDFKLFPPTIYIWSRVVGRSVEFIHVMSAVFLRFRHPSSRAIGQTG